MFVRVNNLAEFEKVLHSIEDVPVAVDLLKYLDEKNFTNKGYLYVTSDQKTTFILETDMFNKDFGHYIRRKMIISNYSFVPDYYGRDILNINFDFFDSDSFPSLLNYIKNGKLYGKTWYSADNRKIKEIYNEIDYISEQHYPLDKSISFYYSMKSYNNDLLELKYIVNDNIIDYNDIKEIFTHLPDRNTVKETDLDYFLTKEEKTILEMTFIWK